MVSDNRDRPGRASESHLDELFIHYVDRLNAGEGLDREEIRSRHPELAGRLLTELEGYEAFGGCSGTGEPLGSLGDYSLRRQLGRGGMGVVYEAWEGSMGRAVALKVLPTGAAADDRIFHRFMREARTAGKLSHRNVVPVYGVGLQEHTPYYAMEYVEGETLAEILARTRDAGPETETPFGKKDQLGYFAALATAFADVADGLQHAHSRGVVHRDVKPSNLILDAGGHLRILDFGLARLEGEEALTLTGDFVGTPLYMSPEQARRKKVSVDHRTDIYSLGATMFEALTGRPPFRGKDHADTLSQIIEREPPQPRKLNPRLPGDLETIVLKCLRKTPGDRYGTAEALGQDLRRFVRGDPIEARAKGPWEHLGARLRRHHKVLAVLVGFMILAVAIAQIYLERERAEHEALLAEYPTAVLDAVTRLSVGAFSVRAGSAIPGRLFRYSGSILAPVQPADFRTLLGEEGDRPLRDAARDLERWSTLVPERLDALPSGPRASPPGRCHGSQAGATQAPRRPPRVRSRGAPPGHDRGTEARSGCTDGGELAVVVAENAMGVQLGLATDCRGLRAPPGVGGREFTVYLLRARSLPGTRDGPHGAKRVRAGPPGLRRGAPSLRRRPGARAPPGQGLPPRRDTPSRTGDRKFHLRAAVPEPRPRRDEPRGAVDLGSLHLARRV